MAIIPVIIFFALALIIFISASLKLGWFTEDSFFASLVLLGLLIVFTSAFLLGWISYKWF